MIRFINILYGEPHSHRTRLIKQSNCLDDYRHSSRTSKSIVLRASQILGMFSGNYHAVWFCQSITIFMSEKDIQGSFLKNLLSKSITAIILLTDLPSHYTNFNAVKYSQRFVTIFQNKNTEVIFREIAMIKSNS